MRVTGTGHAGLLIETGARRILVDPWMSPEGAFFASWFPYPDNAHLIDAPALRAPNALVLTQDRPDHTDPWLLAQIPPEIPAIVPRYPTPALRRAVLSARERPLIELAPWEIYRLEDGTTIFFVSEESPMTYASAVAIASGAATLLNAGDARLTLAQIRSIRVKLGGEVDLLTVQGAAASWFPLASELPPEKRREFTQRKRHTRLIQTARMIRVAEPKLAALTAGPPCFLDAELAPFNAELNADGMLPDAFTVAGLLRGRGLQNITTLFPGDTIDLPSMAKTADPAWLDLASSDRDACLRDYALRRLPAIEALRARHPEPTRPLVDELRAHLEDLLSMSAYFNSKINMRVGFEITGPGGGSLYADFREVHVAALDDTIQCDALFTIPSRWLAALLDGDGRIGWGDLLLSLRLRTSGLTEPHSDHLIGLLKLADPAALDAVEAYERAMEKSPFITIHTHGKTYRVQRYCPHAGQDLAEVGDIAPGKVIVCLTHHFEFDLETGRCLNDRCPSIKVTEQ